MKKGVTPNNEGFTSKNAHLLGASPLERLKRGKTLDEETLSRFLADIQNKINEGFANDAEDRCFEILENYANPIEAQAQLNELLSIALEKQGHFAEALKALQVFETEHLIPKLSEETRASFLTQLGVSYAIADDSPKAISLLNTALRIAEDRDLIYLLSHINLAFARVYQELNEFSISRNYAEKTLNFARDLGNWQGLAEAYRVNAVGYFREGNHTKAVGIFQQAVKIIGDRPAKYLLGKIYSDLSSAHSALFRPQDGLDELKKAIGIFEKIGQRFELVIANYNLGISFLLGGDWTKAKEIFTRTKDQATEIKHPYLALISASLAEIEFLQGNYENAENILTEALKSATEAKKERYKVPVLYHLARCLLAQGEVEAAILQAKDAVDRGKRGKEKHLLHLSNLVLAEAYLKKRKTARAEQILQDIEAEEVEKDYLVLGNAARIRALMAFAEQNEDLTLHHFNRSLSIFELAGDRFNSAVINFEIGKILLEKQTDKAIKSLESAAEIFQKLGAVRNFKLAGEILTKRTKKEVSQKREQIISSQLLMLRLVEAVSSRELLTRELVTILRQNSKAKKTMIAELQDGKKFQPSVIDGFTPNESVELLNKLHEAQSRNELDIFSKEKNLSVYQLRSPHSAPALLVISPTTGANLADGSPIQPLLQVTELGLEVCALREISKDKPPVTTYNPFIVNSIMPGFIHSSPAMMDLVEEIQKIQTSDVTVLITGESGTGKELIARAVHHLSPRKEKVFVPFNCTAVPKELTEGHLFGYKKGAFTGAVSDSEGMIRSADGGTLFLDEIGDLGLDVQPKILRFLQEGEVQPLGEKAPKKVDVRIIAATNMHVEEMVRKGLFREDLYYRLNVIRLQIPPLRERRSEIPQLIDYYLKHYSAKFGRKDLTMSSEALDLLIAYHWQGNVRQLCNEVQRMVARSSSGDKITPQHLSAEIKPGSTSTNSNDTSNVRAIGLTSGTINIKTEGASLDEAVTALETQMITESLSRHNHNISRVAKELNLTRRGLYLKLERYNLK
ncbi:MAG: sigma 54-interacting transcriptional regulator [Pyrinomonadaceae bacterium]|nr:sigma 54-interacting transcriptional regulator [Pyrinomonadaceae bacterium]